MNNIPMTLYLHLSKNLRKCLKNRMTKLLLILGGNLSSPKALYIFCLHEGIFVVRTLLSPEGNSAHLLEAVHPTSQRQFIPHLKRQFIPS